MTRPPKQYHRGLTILELLVAMVALAVLAALIFPAVQRMNDRAAMVNCAANMRSVGVILQAWRADHDGYFPTGIVGKQLVDPITDGNQNPQNDVDVGKALHDDGYLDKNDVLFCPAMRLSDKGKTLLKSGESAKSRLKTYGSYNLNVFLLQVKPASLPGRNWWGTNPYPGDAKMLFLAESHAGIGSKYSGGVVWASSQFTTALDGVDYGSSINVKGRDHGNSRLNFMLLDGRIVLLAPKITADGTRVWQEDSTDPEIPFDSWGRRGKYIGTGRLRE